MSLCISSTFIKDLWCVYQPNQVLTYVRTYPCMHYYIHTSESTDLEWYSEIGGSDCSPFNRVHS